MSTIVDPAAVAHAIAIRKPLHHHTLYDLLPAAHQAPEYLSVFIDPAWCARIDKPNGPLGDAYREQGTTQVVNNILRHLSGVIPALKAADPTYFDYRDDYSHFEVTFHAPPSGRHQTSVVFFDPDGTTAEEIL